MWGRGTDTVKPDNGVRNLSRRRRIIVKGIVKKNKILHLYII